MADLQGMLEPMLADGANSEEIRNRASRVTLAQSYIDPAVHAEVKFIKDVLFKAKTGAFDKIDIKKYAEEAGVNPINVILRVFHVLRLAYAEIFAPGGPNANNALPEVAVAPVRTMVCFEFCKLYVSMNELWNLNIVTYCMENDLALQITVSKKFFEKSKFYAGATHLLKVENFIAEPEMVCTEMRTAFETTVLSNSAKTASEAKVAFQKSLLDFDDAKYEQAKRASRDDNYQAYLRDRERDRRNSNPNLRAYDGKIITNNGSNVQALEELRVHCKETGEKKDICAVFVGIPKSQRGATCGQKNCRRCHEAPESRTKAEIMTRAFPRQMGNYKFDDF